MEVGDNIMISSTTSTDSSNHRMLKIALAAYDCYLNCIRLKQYVVINTTGVRKILKKHDKQTLGNPTLLQDHSNTPQFISNLLYKLDLAQLDAIIEKLDHLCLKYQMFGTLTMTEKMKLEGLNLLKPTRRLPFDIMDKENFIIDMDGVIYHGTQLLPGVKTFISWLKRENKKFLVK